MEEYNDYKSSAKPHFRRSLSPFSKENNNEYTVSGLQSKHTNTFMQIVSARDQKPFKLNKPVVRLNTD